MTSPPSPLPEAERGNESLTPPEKKTFLQHAGTVAMSIVKHVPTRGVLWGVIGFFLGWVFIALSWVLILLTMGRGAMLAAYFFAVMIAIPFLGSAAFAVHGLQRGAARAALDLEGKFGLVKWVVAKIMGYLEEKLGGRLSNLPLGQFEERLKAAIDKYLGSDDMHEGRGIVGWVLRRSKKAIVDRVETYTLSAYRAEQQEGAASGGGVSMQKVGTRVSEELSGHLGDFVMSPLNTQLWIFIAIYAVIGIGWMHIILGLIALLSKIAGN